MVDLKDEKVSVPEIADCRQYSKDYLMFLQSSTSLQKTVILYFSKYLKSYIISVFNM